MILTKFELHNYSERIDQINEELNNDSIPEDIVDNLMNELANIQTILEKSIKATRIEKSGLRLAK